MADIKPFQAYRPRQGLEGKIAALPYDVYNREEATLEVKRNPMSFLSIDRAETLFPKEVDTYADVVYQKARERLMEYIEKGYFVKDEKECYYLYELVMNGRSQTGIVACASIDDYLNNVIKKHENTREDKELDRIRHVDTCNMQTGPIFLAYRRNPVLKETIGRIQATKPACAFQSEDGILHRVWVIENTDDIRSITEAFAATDSIYIADGHHRCASAVKVGLKRRQAWDSREAEYFLSVLFSEDELMIMDYNRFVKDLNGNTAEQFLQKIAEVAKVEKLQGNLQNASDAESIKPSKKGTMSMYLAGQWYRLTIKAELLSSDPVMGLDVSLLQNLVLEPILGIQNPKTDKRIDFIGGIRGLKELEKRCEMQGDNDSVAFAMYPTSIQELFSVADAGKLMPPKSTWFEPKLRSGLFIHSLEA